MAAARIAAATLSGSRIDARAVCQPRLDRYSRESVLWLGMPSVLHAASAGNLARAPRSELEPQRSSICCRSAAGRSGVKTYARAEL